MYKMHEVSALRGLSHKGEYSVYMRVRVDSFVLTLIFRDIALL